MLREAASDLRTRRNYPYRGRADGFVTALRLRHAARDYAGIELEVNQRHVAAAWPRLEKILPATLLSALRSVGILDG